MAEPQLLPITWGRHFSLPGYCNDEMTQYIYHLAQKTHSMNSLGFWENVFVRITQKTQNFKMVTYIDIYICK